MEAELFGGFDITRVPMPERPMKQRISSFVRSNGGDLGGWYIGLAGDPDRDLFRAHRVNRTFDTYTYFMADEPRTARRVKRFYVERGMCDGERSPPGENWVYVYHITKGTRQ
ncbi:MAG: hypothetical protein L0Z54_02545 [Thermoplasmata archaeon]|nr:hypothetical protein [Thermoplasmata archaeon]